jgi:8-oxo-dGTP pyrophosphatase MutT (NUDIX family)
MLNEILEKYFKLFPADQESLNALTEQVKRGEDLSDRTNYRGHITGGAVVLSPDLTKLLLVFYPPKQTWLQPGGHWDPPEEGPWQTSEREAQEETGVKIAKRLHINEDKRVPLSISSHLIPTNPPKNEPEHYHHDFRYGFIAASENLELNDDVIQEAKWVTLDAHEADSIRKELERLLPLAQNLKA